MTYREFLHTKIEVARASGFEVDTEQINPWHKTTSKRCGYLGAAGRSKGTV